MSRYIVVSLLVICPLSTELGCETARAREGNLGESFGLLLIICPVLVRGCGTLGKALVLREGLCELWQVCCLGRPHFRVRYVLICLNSMICRENLSRGCKNSKYGRENTTRGCLLSKRGRNNSTRGFLLLCRGCKNSFVGRENSTRESYCSKAGQEISKSSCLLYESGRLFLTRLSSE